MRPNATLKVRRAGAEIRAPDAVPVRPYDLAPASQMALAEGTIEPGADYHPHAHRTIEQITYVLAGRVRITSYDAHSGGPRSIELGPGEAVITLPGESLQFTCIGSLPARVLFMTAPPYPADHSDTVVLDTHRMLASRE